VNNIFAIILISVFLNNCSFNKNSKFWTKEEIVKEAQSNQQKILVDETSNKNNDLLGLEFNKNLKISFISEPINNSFSNNFDNNNGRINYDGMLKNKSKYKFSKISNFYKYNPKINFEKNNLIFFDNKGTILKFDDYSKLLWKKNYYSKSEIKLKPILFFSNNGETLIIADNISNYYAIDIKSGKLLWKKNNKAPFNSQVKIYKNLFFVVDYDNTLKAFSIRDGNEAWSVKTEPALIRSQKKLSIVIIDKKIYFNNSIGDISAVDIKTGELIWQKPTQSSVIYDQAFFLQTSTIIADKNSLYFSNNKNEFFSIDITTGIINWKQNINSNLRPTLIDNYLLTVSLEGFLIIIEKNSGNIIRSTDIFKGLLSDNKMKLLQVFDKENEKKQKIRPKFKPTGFIVGKNNIYLSTDHGRLFIIDITTGITKSILKIDNDKISRPSVLNQKLYITKDNSIIKLN